MKIPSDAEIMRRRKIRAAIEGLVPDTWADDAKIPRRELVEIVAGVEVSDIDVFAAYYTVKATHASEQLKR